MNAGWVLAGVIALTLWLCFQIEKHHPIRPRHTPDRDTPDDTPDQVDRTVYL